MTTLSTSPGSDVDADVARRVALFLAQRRVSLPKNLSIGVRRGILTLQGVANSYHHRQLLISAAQRVAGVVQIVDELQVPRTEAFRPRGSSATHAFLSTASIVAVVVAALSMGCGRSGPARLATVPVKGAVTFQGQPASGAFLALHSKNRAPDSSPAPTGAPTPTAIVQPDGTFTLTTYDAGDGVPAGDYVVTIQWRKAIKAGGDFLPGPNLLPAKYSRPETSDVVVHVAVGQNELPPITLRR